MRWPGSALLASRRVLQGRWFSFGSNLKHSFNSVKRITLTELNCVRLIQERVGLTVVFPVPLPTLNH